MCVSVCIHHVLDRVLFSFHPILSYPSIYCLVAFECLLCWIEDYYTFTTHTHTHIYAFGQFKLISILVWLDIGLIRFIWCGQSNLVEAIHSLNLPICLQFIFHTHTIVCHTYLRCWMENMANTQYPHTSMCLGQMSQVWSRSTNLCVRIEGFLDRWIVMHGLHVSLCIYICVCVCVCVLIHPIMISASSPVPFHSFYIHSVFLLLLVMSTFDCKSMFMSPTLRVLIPPARNTLKSI